MIGALGLPELLIIVLYFAFVIGIVWFVIWAIVSHLQNQRNIREVLERIAESLEQKS